MKVLYTFGGIPHYLSAMLNKLCTKGVEITVVTPQKGNATIGKGVKMVEGGTYKHLTTEEKKMFYGKSAFPALPEIIAEEKPDIVVVGWPYFLQVFFQPVLRKAMKSCNAKLVIREIPFQTPPYGKIKEYFKANPMHDEGMRLLSKGIGFYLRQWITARIRKYCYAQAAGTLNYSTAAYDILPSYGVKKAQIHVTYNSTDTEALLKEKESVLASPSILPPCDRRLLHIGRLVKWKRVDLLIEAFRKKGSEFAHVIKMGRTQLEDAVPMTLGQTFNGFASILEHELKNLDFAAQDFLTVNMGATAIGTGITAEPEYAEKCIAALRKITGLDIKLADDLIGATSDTSCMVGYSSAMRRVAVKMNKICNDLRLLASGPRCGLGEINLPAMQPGSSIMPGKVNPVIPEVMNQVAYKVIGNDLCVAMSGEAAQMELNAMEPVMAQCCFESADLLMNGFDTLRTLCIDGITANEDKCRRDVHNSIGVVTALNPVIGYKHSTKIAKEALETGKGVYELVLEHDILSKEDLDTILEPENMIKSVKLDIHPNH